MAVGPCFVFFGWKQEHFGWTSFFFENGDDGSIQNEVVILEEKVCLGKIIMDKTTCRDCDVQKIIFIFLDLRI